MKTHQNLQLETGEGTSRSSFFQIKVLTVVFVSCLLSFNSFGFCFEGPDFLGSFSGVFSSCDAYGMCEVYNTGIGCQANASCYLQGGMFGCVLTSYYDESSAYIQAHPYHHSSGHDVVAAYRMHILVELLDIILDNYYVDIRRYYFFSPHCC